MAYKTVPLELINLNDDGFHLLVEVVVFGQSFNAVLDTGASKTVFDKETIETFSKSGELMASDRVSTGLGANNMESHSIILPTLKIGKMKLKNFEAAVLDLTTIKQAYSSLNLPPIIGVIGGDILNSHQAIINYRKLKLKLFK
ncbi:retropepsin-like aspartic protease [Daejeonella sp.]|jgi:predicted aspartyl protease|uniref:retropepsin-like aspartic protease n=1 Tax=Daejeonella sp. TaxID=2805397 RepID=UPI0025BC4A6B|nr:retropepsin-like aspartic protease [Daejeonella sp.]